MIAVTQPRDSARSVPRRRQRECGPVTGSRLFVGRHVIGPHNTGKEQTERDRDPINRSAGRAIGGGRREIEHGKKVGGIRGRKGLFSGLGDLRRTIPLGSKRLHDHRLQDFAVFRRIRVCDGRCAKRGVGLVHAQCGDLLICSLNRIGWANFNLRFWHSRNGRSNHRFRRYRGSLARSKSWLLLTMQQPKAHGK